VDAIQAVGALPVDAAALDLDMVVTGAHKWLMGMEGAGFCGLSARALQALAPRTAGWLSHEDPVRFFARGAPGTCATTARSGPRPPGWRAAPRPVLGFAALQAGMAPLLELGVPAIAAHIGAYLDRLEPALQERGFVSLRSPLAAQRAGILSVDPPAGRRSGGPAGRAGRPRPRLRPARRPPALLAALAQRARRD
jgi:cysteine desulfurase/selenocysteine lyase